MRFNLRKAVLETAVLAGALLCAGTAVAADVYLTASQGTNSAADGADVWRFQCDATQAPAGATCEQSGEAAPTITVASSESLSIHVTNSLPVPVSVFIPGIIGDGASAAPNIVGGRVQSFAQETTTTGTYSWPTLRPGTFLFQSGTQPSLQVPMGLFGALIVTDPAYPGVTANSETLMLFSEIDPIQNARVAAAAAGGMMATPNCTSLAEYEESLGTAGGYPCTIDYSPAYYLINGEATPDLGGLTAGNTVLLRMLNAGSRTHTPAFVNLEMALYAEDGNLYPNPLLQSEATLAAGKTFDAIVVLPSTPDLTIAMHDRSPSFSDNNQPTGGAWANLQVGNGSPAGPTANTAELAIDVLEDTPFQWDPPGGNGLRVVGNAMHGTVETVNSAGTLNFLYTPHADFAGTDTFTYFRPGNETTYYVTVNVEHVNDAPVGMADSYGNTFDTSITVEAPGVLANDADVDGDSLTATLVGTSPAGLTFNADGSFDYTGAAGIVTFEYIAEDNGITPLQSDPITVTLTTNEVTGLALDVREPGGTPVTNYRWLVQEFTGFHVDPQNPAPLHEQQSLNFHVSHMPVIAEGCYGCLTDVNIDPQSDFPGPGDMDYDGDGIFDGASNIDIADLRLDPTKHYYVSVLPNDAGTGTGHTVGGAQIPALGAGATAYDPISVIVNPHEIPTAQISVYVFEDQFPTNGAPDAPEPGLGGFQVIVEDAGGKYGMSGGTMFQDAFGTPLTNSLPCAPPAAPGIILSCDDGTVLIENLAPGKYGIVVVPPVDDQNWIQTSTIEGSKVIDAWVKADEPAFFAEFGNPSPHVFVGWVNPATTVLPDGVAPGSNTVTGNVTMLHNPRPPGLFETIDSGSYAGLSFTRAWVGINSVGGDGANIATVQANEDGSFEFTGIPDGDYQVVVWDSYLDQIIAFQAFTLTGTGADLGNVPVHSWFARVEHNVFLDSNENGIYDDGELPLPEQAVNLRWRDGTMNQSFPTDSEGFVPFDEIFPFFHWQLWEVDYTRMKPTGMTTIVDAGGTVDATGPYAGLLNSQYDANTVQNDGPSTERTELGETVLVQAWQGFPGQTSIIDWGKVPWQPGENGGISGIVSYGSTRGEADPRLTVMDPWEPGIPGVEVRLYREVELQGGGTGLALIQTVTTDSWDDSLPTDCEGEILPGQGDPFVEGPLNNDSARCYDGWRNWNQVRPGVFDGGYAFTDIPPGKYVVEAVPPPGFQIIKEQDINVGFGDVYGNPPVTGFAPVSVVLPNGMVVTTIPDWAMVNTAGIEPGLAQPPCVGPNHLVPPELSLFPGEAAPFAGSARALCTHKEVLLSDQGQAAADFHIFTATPLAAQFTGLITDDLAVETNKAVPGFGEKFSPPYLPFALRDYKGQVVYKGYSDAFGHYNGIIPSTFTANVPIPSGYSPAMNSICLNDGGDGAELDPQMNPNYGTACYTFQFMPGTTTYLDTPVLPQSAFAAGYNPADCSAPAGTPVITVVRNRTASTEGPLFAPGDEIVIRSAGRNARVPNPQYEGPQAPAPFNRQTIRRDQSFGQGNPANRGTVQIIADDGTVYDLAINSWNRNRIRAVAPDVPVTGQLVVTRGDGNNAGSQSVNSVTVTVSATETATRVAPGGSIQAAIDAAAPGDLIIVEPGVYEELVVMWKPVRLQGSGTSTIINAVQRPVDKLEDWNAKVQGLVDNGDVSLVPGQPTAGTPFAPGLLGNEQGAGITVLAKGGPGSGCFGAAPGDGCFNLADARIDGFTISGGQAGGIFVNGWARNLEIANNNIDRNSGALHGGIRVGHPYLPLEGDGPFVFNPNVNIHNNAITRNGATGELSAGGGISLATGSNAYVIESNFVCGNFAMGDGGGIAHLGLSNGGRIEDNDILFNQSYNAGLTNSGGGLFIAGEQPAPPTVPGVQPELLSLGTGNVNVIANRIQGNQAGSGHGGGIRAERVNGRDVVNRPNPNQWYRLRMVNNIVVNNVASWSGGGISLLDTVNAIINNNTVANNDTTATAGSLLLTPGDVSTPQPAGISTQQHSLVLAAALADRGVTESFSNPMLVNNIVWQNRAFYYDGTMAPALQPALTPAANGECAAGANYWDLGVLGGAGQLNPRRSLLTDTTGYHGSNITGDPDFDGGYCNGSRALSTPGPMLASAALGEGGNFVDVRYGPLTHAFPVNSATSIWDYHIGAASAAIDTTWGGPGTDFDGEDRPAASSSNPARDRGADERQ